MHRMYYVMYYFKIANTVELAYNEREKSAIFARYNRVLVIKDSLKNPTNAYILTILYEVCLKSSVNGPMSQR